MAAKEKTAILCDESPFTIKEAYKSLRTNVTFSIPGDGGKCIGVTSGARGEGKSTSCVNLAISYGQVGNKVILLDGDMRLPTVSEKTDLPNAPGLSDLIVGETNLSNAVKESKYGIDVIPAGRIPKDPTGILESERMSMLIAKLKEIYDFVFIDLPPVTTVSDAAILAPSIDGYLLVVRHEMTELKEIAEMVRLLKISEAKILGFIYNDASVESKKYYSKYYKK